MKNQKEIGLIALIIIIIMVVAGIMLIFNGGKYSTKIKWGYIPSSEYYELRLAATTSELSNGTGTLSQSSFNSLGKDIKKAGGKWFKDSNVNFKASATDEGSTEITTLSDGENTATFIFDNVSDYVSYTFEKENHYILII